jgi:hypothetical protein
LQTLTVDENMTSTSKSHPIIAAATFIFPFTAVHVDDDKTWSRAGKWLIVWGLLAGIVLAAVFRGSWRLFGEYQYIRWLPAAAVLTADVAFVGYRFLQGSVRVASHQPDEQLEGQPPLVLPGVLTLGLILLVKYACFVSIPIGRWQVMPPTGLDAPAWWFQIRSLLPAVIYRPLILMPVWGCWAAALALTVGRCTPTSPGYLRAFSRGIGVGTVFLQWVLAAALTAWFCSGSGTYLAQALLIPVVVLLLTYLLSFALARRCGGQSVCTVLAAGMWAEIVFLLTYLTITGRIYW